jgi:hypothetical protein
MKKYISLLILYLIIAFNANAQFSASYSLSYGNYKMDDMKDFLNNMTKAIEYQLSGIPVAVVDNFPGYIIHNLDLSYNIKRHEIGFRGTYMTTGGKIAYSDYTGEYSETLLLNGFRLGANYRFYFPFVDSNKSGSLCLFAEISPGITFSKLKSREYIKIFDHRQETDENLDLSTNGISLLPQLGIKWQIAKHIGIHLSGGYDFQLGSRFKYEGAETKITSDWSGIRINGGVSFSW